MKQFRIYILFGVAFALFGIEVFPVHAQNQECTSVSALFQMDSEKEIIPKSGASISIEQSVSGIQNVKNVVVFGQDQDEEGVSITVNVNSVEGRILHDEWVDEKLCIAHSAASIPPPNYEMCPPYNDFEHMLVYYYETVPVCHPDISQTVTRHIKNVRIWLEATPETVDWLGWNPETKGGKASIRYVFPNQWVAGYWTADGFETGGFPNTYWSETYSENFKKQLADANFLAGDTNIISSLWSVTLDEVRSPVSNNPSLAIFGPFTLYTLPVYIPTAPTGGELTVDYGRINENTKKKWARSYPNSSSPLPSDLTNLTIELIHVPLDLPGKWFIGVMVEMEKASVSYGEKTITETTALEEWSVFDSKWFTQEDSGSNMNDNYFYSYVLLSVPCNDLEEDGCWDGTY